MNWRTHDVFNQCSELSGYNLFTTDRALTEAIRRCADWSSEQLTTFGARLGSIETYALADKCEPASAGIANLRRARSAHRFRRLPSVLAFGAWMYREQGLVSLPFREQRPGRWSA
jgi:putative acyl-CoA dehydrogenase